MLRPGGLVLLIESDLTPVVAVDGKAVALSRDETKLGGWFTLWRVYRECLRRQGIDISVPQRLSGLLTATQAFENVVTHGAHIPVGFWPKGKVLYRLSSKSYNLSSKDEHQLTAGQLQWLNYDLFIPALKPFFLSMGVPESNVDRTLKNAQRDLYYPSTPYFALIHIVYALKRTKDTDNA